MLEHLMNIQEIRVYDNSEDPIIRKLAANLRGYKYALEVAILKNTIMAQKDSVHYLNKLNALEEEAIAHVKGYYYSSDRNTLFIGNLAEALHVAEELGIPRMEAKVIHNEKTYHLIQGRDKDTRVFVVRGVYDDESCIEAYEYAKSHNMNIIWNYYEF